MSAELTNPRAERVRSVAALAGRSARRRTGRFLVEGPQAVREAVVSAAVPVDGLYLTSEAAQRYPEIVSAAQSRHLRVHLGDPAVLDAMSPDAQHVVAVVEQRHGELGPVLAARPRLLAVLAHVRDPGNAGTVLRVADAAGADAVLLSTQSVDVHNPKVVRSTAGSLFHLPVVEEVSLPAAVAALHGAGLTVLAADGRGDLDLDDLQDRTGTGSPDLASPTAWLFGNEAWGLGEEDLALADAVVRVPLHGRAESLNLATAAAVCLYASARAHRHVRV